VTTPQNSTGSHQSPVGPPAFVASDSFRRDLAGQITGEVRFDDLSRALYATDASVYQIVPAGVVIPRSREDVVRTVQICARHGCSITARGGGTSQAGQAVGAGMQLDFSKYLNRVIAINPGERWVRVEPGMVLDELNAQLKGYGLHLPLDISTSDRATIGGMIANNSSGTRSVVYGKTLDYVLELTAVLSDGSVVELRPIAGAPLDTKCGQAGLEGDCYRAVRRLVDEHAAEIERRFPKILRRVGGYNLDEFVERSDRAEREDREADAPRSPAATTPPPFNLARLIVGSEGTLCMVVDAKMRLAPLPAARSLMVVHFEKLLDALAATVPILAHRPSAVELVDRFVLDATRGKTEYEPLRRFISGDPEAMLIVEFFGDSADEVSARLEALDADLRARGIGYHRHRAIDAAEQARIWRLRRAALGLSMSERGDAKAISFVEDTAVAADRLRDYIDRFQQILAAHDTRAGFYAHASVGLLHVRPVVNLKTADGLRKFQIIADQIADLVLEFGGALSGEHGDGLVRSPFQEKLYGPELYRAFCEIKRAFDPAGIFNPGKIVHARPITENLRYGAGTQTADPATAFDFADYGGLARAAEQCSGIGECRKSLAGTMCPSYMATRDECDSTRGRANALRMALATGGSGLRLGDRELESVLGLCLECKACKSECPTGVDMARLKAEFLHRVHETNGTTLRTRLLARPDRLGRWGCRLTPVSNWLVQSRAARWLAERLLGISRHRTPPRFHRRTFEAWHAERRASRSGGSKPAEADAQGSGVPSRPPGPAVVFVDTFTNYFEPEIGIAATELLELAGFDVAAFAGFCCGRPLISQGLLREARERGAATVDRLHLIANAGASILFCEPSCLSALRDDVPALLRGEERRRAEAVARACMPVEDFIERSVSAGDVRFDLTPGPSNVLLHGHCHQKALGMMGPTVALLSRVPKSTLSVPDAGCCGMAGSFGYLAEHFSISRRIAEHRLMPAVRGAPAGTVVLAPGTSCRQQIRQFAGVDAVHPIVFLRSLLKEK
jgi:FAD/FMN-containing dehydrogenase/Fe-S oxidoreductase